MRLMSDGLIGAANILTHTSPSSNSRPSTSTNLHKFNDPIYTLCWSMCAHSTIHVHHRVVINFRRDSSAAIFSNKLARTLGTHCTRIQEVSLVYRNVWPIRGPKPYETQSRMRNAERENTLEHVVGRPMLVIHCGPGRRAHCC
jgi:hypothetical protein